MQVNRVGNIDIHAQNLHMPQLKEELKEVLLPIAMDGQCIVNLSGESYVNYVH